MGQEAGSRMVTLKNKHVPTRTDFPYQLANHFHITSNEDGFFLSFGTADPYNIDEESREVPIHPVAKVFVGRYLMQSMLQVLLQNPAVLELPAFKAAKEAADEALSALVQEAGDQEDA